MFGLGPWEILLIVAVLILLFGASRIPLIGRGMGAAIRNFKRAMAGRDEGGTDLPPGEEPDRHPDDHHDPGQRGERRSRGEGSPPA